MPQGLEDIKNTLARITRGDSMIDLLIEFERTLDATELFSYKNWYCGELIKGPTLDRYWFTTTWMFPHKLMPDPRGALRLEKIGCQVYFEKDTLLQPRRVLTPKDWQNQKTKEAKLEELPVWAVTIVMPVKYVTEHLDAYQDFIDDSIDSDKHEIEQEMQGDPEADEAIDGLEDGETASEEEEL